MSAPQKSAWRSTPYEVIRSATSRTSVMPSVSGMRMVRYWPGSYSLNGKDMLQGECGPDSSVRRAARSTPDPLEVVRAAANDRRCSAKHHVVIRRMEVAFGEDTGGPFNESCIPLLNSVFGFLPEDALAMLRVVPADKGEVTSGALQCCAACRHPHSLGRGLKSRSPERVGGPEGVRNYLIRMKHQGGDNICPHHQVLERCTQVRAVPVRRFLLGIDGIELSELRAGYRIANALKDSTGHPGTVGDGDPRLRHRRVDRELGVHSTTVGLDERPRASATNGQPSIGGVRSSAREMD